MGGSVAGLERALREEGVGEVQFDAFARGRYATDASSYQIMPLGVVVPGSIEEATRALGVARSRGVPVLPRGGGTSQSGQTVNAALVVDCSKRLDQDPVARCAGPDAARSSPASCSTNSIGG